MIKWRNRDTRNALFDAVKNGNNIIVYDLETTGLNPEVDRPIQISGMKIRYNGTVFDVLDTFDHYINPEIPIPAKITEITGINDETVENAPIEKDLFNEIRAFFGDDFVASGYNIARFDNKFMQNMYKRYGVEFSPISTTDVLEMARDNVNQNETENFKLGTIAALYGVDKGLTFHNSMDDVTATERLLCAFYDEYKESYEEDEGIKSDASKVKIASVSRISFWEGYKGFSRIYVVTNVGEFYFDCRRKVWGIKPGNPYEIDDIDMNSLREKVLEKGNVGSEEDLIKKYTPKANKVTLVPTEVSSLKRWERIGSNGSDMKRIYITTDVGDFYYDIIKNKWMSNTGSPNETVDVDKLMELCFAKANVTNISDFANFR